jgi:hypothetical protein
MYRIILGASLLVLFTQYGYASEVELIKAYCKVEQEAAVKAAENRLSLVPFEEASDEAIKMFDDVEGLSDDYIAVFKRGIEAKVTQVYHHYSWEMIKKDTFSDTMVGRFIVDLVEEQQDIIKVEKLYVEKVSDMLNFTMEDIVTEDIRADLSNEGARCMLQNYSSEKHQAMRDFVVFIAVDIPREDSNELIMQMHGNDPEATAAFSRLQQNMDTCIKDIIETLKK